MFKIKNKFYKGSKLFSISLILVSGLISAGIIWGANMYYDIDTGKVMVNEIQRIVKTGANALEVIGTAIFGSDTNYARFSETGDLSFVGTADTISKTDAAFTITATGGTFTINATGQTMDIDSAALDIDASGALTMDSATSIAIGATADKPIDIDASTLTIDASDNANLTVTGAGKTLTLAAAGGGVNQVILQSAGTGANAIYLNASDTAGGIDVDAGTGGVAVDTTGPLSLDSTGTAANLTLTANNAGAATLVIAVSNIGAGAAYLDIDANEAITIDSSAGGISLDGVTASNFTVTGASQDLTLSSVGGSVGISATEAAADAISLQASAGGIDVNGALQINIDSSQAAATAIVLKASNAAGGIDIDAGTGGITVDSTGVISLDGADSSNFTVTGAGKTLTLAAAGGGANQVIINSAGTSAGAIDINAAGTVAGNAITVHTTDGGISITAGGAVNGDLTLTVGDDFNLDAVGALIMEFGAASGFKLQNDAGAVVHLEIDSNGKVIIRSGTDQDIVLDPGGTGSIILSGDVIGSDTIQEIVPIFGFDLPAQTKSATYKTVSRVLESDPFSTVAAGKTRKYKFVIRYADELATGTSSWSVCPAATDDASCTESFTVPYSTRTLGDGSTTATGAQVSVTSLVVASTTNFDVDNWIFVDNAGTDYWARITAVPDATHLTLLTAVSADASAPVKEYTTNIDKGDVEITALQTPITYPWRLAVKMDGTNSIRIYQIFLAAYDIE